MKKLFADAINLLLGRDDSENTPLDFKEELAASINNNIVDKAKATLLITARNIVDKLGKDIDKKQINDVSGKGKTVERDGRKKTVEEIEIEDNKIEKKEKQKKENEKRKHQEESLRQTIQRIAMEDERQQLEVKNKQKE